MASPFDTPSSIPFAQNLDVVAILDADSMQQVFADARPLKAAVRETSRVMFHPAETGVQLADHHIINPNEIDVPLMISAANYASMYQQIKAAFVASTLLIVQMRTDVYQNMIVADMPHEESPEIYDAVVLALHLKEVLFETPNAVAPQSQPAGYAPADPANSDTAQSGQQQPAAWTGSTGTLSTGGTTGTW